MRQFLGLAYLTLESRESTVKNVKSGSRDSESNTDNPKNSSALIPGSAASATARPVKITLDREVAAKPVNRPTPRLPKHLEKAALDDWRKAMKDVYSSRSTEGRDPEARRDQAQRDFPMKDRRRSRRTNPESPISILRRRRVGAG
jgi:hypothetical protein